ncbi:tRNA (adenosine(37)-N6)-threonylcarbamoyltransferase complex transferase subunit TsaD [Ichthyobacterium seriolicida]|uniref:tRNA N6-adenosine threonylcarbamoyltransferase n=1 Tax=Ichthyobacterium seriolicida TaxID=242600 RepID=A0A1J1DXB9_9FLAO|nr:tRNA (adenosine(37)-N6)-threonylcarbamoyltransferase complex transferase subunit TsaD [Ichthyobacterium seriolicida]BAV94473.1 O-sialoglycoprotein endopeptidase [Ichthyobacterium seriolicida]
MKTEITILGIESSCDDTGVAVIRDRAILSNIVASQSVHEEFGGVVPELASRSHLQNIVPTLQRALDLAKVEKKDLNAIAFTEGPGLLGSLLVGSSFAKSMSMALGIPLIGINHMQGHILAHFIERENHSKPEFPFLCLTISGGHTQIVEVRDYFDMQVIGETIDDAVGELFDKSARMLGLSYPGGMLIDKYAKTGNPLSFKFTQPKVEGLNFSFSGLKTNILYFLKKNTKDNDKFIIDNIEDICASIQYTIVETLLSKLLKASLERGIKNIALAGGVSSNSRIREELTKYRDKFGWKTHILPFEYCTDNAAMIAITAYFKYLKNDFSNMSISSKSRMKF